MYSFLGYSKRATSFITERWLFLLFILLGKTFLKHKYYKPQKGSICHRIPGSFASLHCQVLNHFRKNFRSDSIPKLLIYVFPQKLVTFSKIIHICRKHQLEPCLL